MTVLCHGVASPLFSVTPIIWKRSWIFDHARGHLLLILLLLVDKHTEDIMLGLVKILAIVLEEVVEVVIGVALAASVVLHGGELILGLNDLLGRLLLLSDLLGHFCIIIIIVTKQIFIIGGQEQGVELGWKLANLFIPPILLDIIVIIIAMVVVWF